MTELALTTGPRVAVGPAAGRLSIEGHQTAARLDRSGIVRLSQEKVALTLALTQRRLDVRAGAPVVIGRTGPPTAPASYALDGGSPTDTYLPTPFDVNGGVL